MEAGKVGSYITGRLVGWLANWLAGGTGWTFVEIQKASFYSLDLLNNLQARQAKRAKRYSKARVKKNKNNKNTERSYMEADAHYFFF